MPACGGRPVSHHGHCGNEDGCRRDGSGSYVGVTGRSMHSSRRSKGCGRGFCGTARASSIGAVGIDLTCVDRLCARMTCCTSLGLAMPDTQCLGDIAGQQVGVLEEYTCVVGLCAGSGVIDFALTQKRANGLTPHYFTETVNLLIGRDDTDSSFGHFRYF